MIRLVAFDLDGTLAEVGKPITENTIKLLLQLEKKATIIISSGKPIYYLIGMFRQVNLKNPIFIGENGCCIAFSTSLPPVNINFDIPSSYFESRNKILNDISIMCKDGYWLQPNEVMLTFFFKDIQSQTKIREYFKNNKYDDVNIYEHVDSFDVSPKSIDKYNSLEYLAKYLKIKREEVAAIGDGVNDIPMLNYSKVSIGIGPLKENVSYHFDYIDEALSFLINKGDTL